MNNSDGSNKTFPSKNKWTYQPGKVFRLKPLNIQNIREQLLGSSEDDTEDVESDDTEKPEENNGQKDDRATNHLQYKSITRLESQEKDSCTANNDIETREENNSQKDDRATNHLQYKCITHRKSQEQDRCLPDDDIEKREESNSHKNDRATNNLHYKCITPLRSREKEACSLKEVLTEIEKSDRNSDLELKCNQNSSESNQIKKCLSFRSMLDPVPEHVIKSQYINEKKTAFKNKENIPVDIEPINLSYNRNKTENSFDLDLSALSFHTPAKKKDLFFSHVTPKINIIPPSETKSINKTSCLYRTPNVTKNQYALKELFKTPINKPLVGPYYSAKRQQGTPYRSVKKSQYIEVPETSKHPDPVVQPTTLSKWNEFGRIMINKTEYIISNMLGKGGSSEVYHCFTPDEELDVAIKFVSLSDPTTAEGYINEVKLLESLQNCDRIIRMYDYEIKDEHLMVVLEKGTDDLSSILKGLVKKQSHTPLHTLYFYWIEMLHAVRQIHSNGVIHSDLKPANFLRIDSELKLIDFGIASKVQEDMTCVYKSNQEGTCNYISPEALNIQSNGNANSPNFGKPKYKIHFKSDVWSLGCILYQLVYRKTPFQHLNPIWAKLAAINNPKHQIEYPETDWVPPRIVDTIKRCLQHDIRSRPSVEELLEEYEQNLRI